MGSTGIPHQYQPLLNVSLGDEVAVFHTEISGEQVLLVKQERSLHCLRLESSRETANKWAPLWTRESFFDGTSRDFQRSFFADESGWMLAKNREGLQFYRMEGDNLALRHYCSDGRYRDMYGWNDNSTVFQMGHFYSDGGKIGVFTRNKRGVIRFEQMVESVVLEGGSQPLWQLHGAQNVPESWKNSTTRLDLAIVDGSGQYAIVERSSNVISVYKIDENYHLQVIGSMADVSAFSPHDNGRILFGYMFENKAYKDMLILSSAGLQLFEREGTRYETTARAKKISTGLFGFEQKYRDTALMFDVDGDGRDELWLTGPEGIAGYHVQADRLERIYYTLQHDDNVRYAKIMGTVSEGTTSRVIAFGGRQLVSFALSPSTNIQPEKAVGKARPTPDSGSIYVLNSDPEPSVQASLAEQLDTSLLMEPINPMNGNLEFGIPLLMVGKLFNLSTTKFITYQERSDATGSMGAGWSLQIDCIFIDRRSSIFPNDHRFYLIQDGSTSLLSAIAGGADDSSNERIASFTIDGKDRTKITFDKEENQWKVVNENEEIFTYGTYGNRRYVKMEPGSEDWPFPHDRDQTNKTLPSVWYLIRHSDRANQWKEYSYTLDTQNDDYLLDAITTSNDASLKLSYCNQFQNTLFDGFTIRSKTYTQTVNLNYIEQDGIVRLKQISQRNKAVLEFDYDGPSGAMSKIVYPNGLLANFDYTLIEIDPDVLMNSFETHSSPRTAYGPTYLLIADITQYGQVRLRIRDALGSDTIQMDGPSIPMLGKLPVVNYEMFAGETYFAVLLHHDASQSELCLFQSHGDSWVTTPVYLKLPKETNVRAGQDFLLAIEHHRITVVERQDGKWKAQKPFEIEQSSLLYYFSHGFLSYNDRQLKIFVRRGHQWTPEVLDIPAGLLKGSNAVFDRFDHLHDTIENLKRGIRPDALGMYHNVIVFRSLHLDGSKLYSRLHLLQLDHKHKISRRQVVDVTIEDLDTYTFKPPEANGNTFVFGYRLENGRFRLKVIEHHGKLKQEIEKIKEQIEQDIRDNPNAPEEEKRRYRQESHDKINAQQEELFRNITSEIPFAIDPSKLGMIINDAYIITASHKTLFDGIDWSTERIPQEQLTLNNISVDLGPSYKLVRTHQNATFNLVGENQLPVFDTATSNASDLFIRYPAFIAAQGNGTDVKLFDFKRHVLTTLPDGEVLDANSNTLAVISSTTDEKNLLVRSMHSFGVTRQNVVWRHELIDRRKKAIANYYEFNPKTAKPYMDGFLMRDVKIVPASTQAPHGWFKVHYNFANHTMSIKSAYNSDGEFLKHIEPAASAKDNRIDIDGVLVARDGKSIVADFRPYRLSQEVVSYYGFEPYEQNIIGRDKHWSWKGGAIRKEYGNHFLRLGRAGSITAAMIPTVPYDTLVVSCWMRGANKMEDIGKQLSVRFNDKTVTGTVQLLAGDWTYVEVLVEDTNRLQINVASGNSSILDVDHLRVIPAQLNLKVQIYDNALGNVRSTMYASGLLAHRLYDCLGNDRGSIDEQGTVEQLSIVSRTNNSRIEIQPALGEILEATQPNHYSGSYRYNAETVVLRFRYSKTLKTGDVKIVLSSGTFSIKITNEKDAFLIERNNKIKVPSEAEIAIFCSSNHYSVWIDGLLCLESRTIKSGRADRYEINGKNVHVWDAVLLYDASVKVIHLTDFGMPKQVLEFKEASKVVLQEIVYDELHRPAIKTKWTELDSNNSSMLFAYRNDFIKNEENVWKHGQVEGLVTELNEDCEGFPYSRTVYAANPLEEKTVQSLPGKPFAIDGKFAKHFNSESSIDFLENLFPRSTGYRYDDERYPDQSINVIVYNKRDLKVAEYVRTHHGDHHLTTYQYDTSDRLILQLPPSYHELADTFSRTSPFFEDNFTSEQTELQRSWAISYEYDQSTGLMTRKTTPDAGSTLYMYTPEGFLRFVVQPKNRNVMYYTYSPLGELTQRGIVELEMSELAQYLPNDSNLPVSSNYILFDRGTNDVAPLHRHRVESIRKITNDSILSDLLMFNHQGQLITSALHSNTSDFLAIGYKYQKAQIHEIHYPITVRGKKFRLRYDYDHRGKLTAITNAATDQKFVLIENNGMGLPKRMIMQPNTSHAYQRTFQYNQPGYLTKIEDPYLSESIDYIGTGYGGRPIGDGTVQATRFNATWHAHSNSKLLKLKPSHLGTGRRSKLCLDALTSAGYLDAHGRPVKSLYPMLDLNLPIVCRLGAFGHHMAAVLDGRGFPQIYGHKYDYGNHRQLIRAKYFQNVAEESYDPLRSGTFAAIRGITRDKSVDIWNRLREAGFIHTDCATGRDIDCHGLPGKPLFHSAIASHTIASTLSSLMARIIKQRKHLPKSTFDELCSGWYRHDVSDTVTDTCNAIWTMLSEEGFIGSNSNYSLNALNSELRDLLAGYKAYLPEIVGVLYHKLATALSHSSADVQSFSIDANGNHRHFYTGFRRYRFEYVSGTNKIASVFRTTFISGDGLEEVRLDLEHNEDGSVTRAMHKGIERIVYDPLLNRPSEITLTDGRRLMFDYNARGQRLYKHVYDRTGNMIRKKYYLRDVQGKPLIEYDAVYGKDTPEGGTIRATVFLYAEDRLIGFIRNDQFYSVALDHEGSVRLVMKNGEVVAAYDYLPYGELLRSFGDDPNGQLDYRFTGKEWDEETNLYDFYARLYDPELGRFLQMDPKEQYASPYLYAGNSPVSLIDPDGQFAFLIVAALAVGGAYVGASAANNSWNPAKWELKKALVGGLLGGIMGGLAPAGIVGSFTVLSGYIGATAAIGVMTATSVGFAYLSIAASNNSWDPSKWDWSQPGTWNALFVGSLTGATLFNAVGGLQKAFASYTGLSRTSFVIVTGTATGGFAFYMGSTANDGSLRFWEWDWSKPGTVWGVINGASFGVHVSPKLHTVTELVTKRLETWKEIGQLVKTGNLEAVAKHLRTEVVAWKQIFIDTIKGDIVKDAMAAGKAAGLMGPTILLDKIPTKGMEAIEEIMTIKKVIDGVIRKKLRSKERRSVAYRNASNTALCLNSGRFQLNMGTPKNEIDFSNDLLWMVSSSSQVSSWLSSLISNIFGMAKNQHTSTNNPQTTAVKPFSTHKKPHRAAFQVPNCFQTISENAISRIVCYEQYGISYVYPYQASEAKPIIEDHYSWCYPLDYDGHPSVACKGKSSSYIFIPHNRHVNYLDHLNGTLTLLLVAPTIVKNVASFFGRLLTNRKAAHKKQGEPLLISKQELTDLDRKLQHLRQTVKIHRKLSEYGQTNNDWLDIVFMDLDEDIRTFLSCNEPTRLLHRQLQDRIEAFAEELAESQHIILNQLYTGQHPILNSAVINNRKTNFETN
ncbi:uncharacterized protein LOC128723867 [Anopheles nili]|uniref:uncharacterized protein LOC128723867 n=1 Tax=Anopheles nili TaxID=185578 RepID=UPI00237B6C4B|nr:uncharacterized protein LOC128723867 [Anopheles nili]